MNEVTPTVDAIRQHYFVLCYPLLNVFVGAYLTTLIDKVMRQESSRQTVGLAH